MPDPCQPCQVTWTESHCPLCQAPNWVRQSAWSSVPLEAVCCHACQGVYWLGEATAARERYPRAWAEGGWPAVLERCFVREGAAVP